MTNINRINTENLTPYNHQKSFGGRAKVKTYAVGSAIVEVLLSYDTEVAATITANGKTTIFRLYDENFFEGGIEGWNHKEFYGYSTTTGKHLEAFHARNNLKWNGKAAWCKIDPVTLEAVISLAENGGRKAA